MTLKGLGIREDGFGQGITKERLTGYNSTPDGVVAEGGFGIRMSRGFWLSPPPGANIIRPPRGSGMPEAGGRTLAD